MKTLTFCMGDVTKLWQDLSFLNLIYLIRMANSHMGTGTGCPP